MWFCVQVGAWWAGVHTVQDSVLGWLRLVVPLSFGVFSVGQRMHGLFHLLFHLLPCWVSYDVPHCPSQVLPSKGLQHVGTCWDMLGQIR